VKAKTVVKGKEGKGQWRLATAKKNSGGTKKPMKTVVDQCNNNGNKENLTNGGEKQKKETNKKWRRME